MFSGAERYCDERKGSESVGPRHHVLGRVVDHDGASTFAGLYGRPLTPRDASNVIEVVRKRLRLAGNAPVDRLRQPKIEKLLIEEWQRAVDDSDRRPPPTLSNTDGDPLLLTSDHFDFDADLREVIIARLVAVDGMDDGGESPAGRELAFARSGNPIHPSWENTILGHLAIGKTSVRLDTNSIPRADALRAHVEAAVGPLVRFRARVHSDPLARVGDEPLAAPEPSSPEASAIVREYKERHYADWGDHPLPALNGKTPRAAVRTKAGKKKVDLLLKEMENHESRVPAASRFDFGPLRTDLGLDP